MGEGLLRALAGDRYEAFSAGTHPAERVHPLAVATLAERGIDIAAQAPKSLSDLGDLRFDLLVTTCDEANEACPYFANADERLHWSLPDPAKAMGADDEVRGAFRAVADDLSKRLGALIAERNQREG
jgi:arsenate reductase (thioredoxin)